MENIARLICKKSNISYIVFSDSLQVLDFSDKLDTIVDDFSLLSFDADIRDVMWELIGMEDKLSSLYNDTSNTIHLPMILKNNHYYDLDIEVFEDSVEKYFIAYFTQKTKESLSYIQTIKEINKKILTYENENKQNQEEHYSLINEKVINFNVNKEGNITVVNDAFMHFFDLNKDAIIAQHFSVFFKTREENLTEISSIILNAKNINNELISFHANVIPITKDEEVYENIIICQDISYLKEVEKELELAANHDSLTGLANPSKLLKRLDVEILKCKETLNSFSICFIDLNKFKSVNDNYGHHAGDMLLKHIAKVLSDFVRKDDMVARVGGDEFVILFDSLEDQEILQNMIQRIQQLAKNNKLHYTDDDIIEFEFSLGLASYPQDAKSAQELLQTADKERYKHKKR